MSGNVSQPKVGEFLRRGVSAAIDDNRIDVVHAFDGLNEDERKVAAVTLISTLIAFSRESGRTDDYLRAKLDEIVGTLIANDVEEGLDGLSDDRDE